MLQTDIKELGLRCVKEEDKQVSAGLYWRRGVTGNIFFAVSAYTVHCNSRW